MIQCTHGTIFSTAQNRFWTRWFWFLLVLLLVFVSPLPHQQTISLWDSFFSCGQTKKESYLGKDQVIGRVGHRGHAVFGQKLLTTQHSVVRCAHKSPFMKWANTLKESSKKFTDAKCSLSQYASWSPDADGFVEHSPRRESLYYKGPTLLKITLGFFGSPLVCWGTRSQILLWWFVT